MAGLIALTIITLQGQSHYGDRYEFGKIYAEKERLKDEIDTLHTDKEIQEWREEQCSHCSCEDNEDQ